MANEVYFISTDYLKNNTVIQNNIDNKVLFQWIILSQDKYIEPILGTKLFRKLENDITGSSVSGIYKTILDDYIQRCLKEWVLYESLPFINYKLTNKSVMRKEGEDSISAELNEIRYLRNGVRDSAEYYSQRLIDYLIENQSSIVEYPNTDSGVDQIQGQQSKYFSGIDLGSKDGGGCIRRLGLGIDLNI